MGVIETIASGRSVRELRRLNRVYGKTTWRKKKGIAKIRLADGTIKLAELHWYEGDGKFFASVRLPMQTKNRIVRKAA